MQEELNAYQQEIKDTREVLKKIRLELKQVQEILRKKKSTLKGLKQEIYQKKLEKENSRLNKEIQNTQEDVIFPKALEEVEIYTNDNQVIMAKPSKRVFDEGLYLQYRSVLRENRLLKNHLSKKDFENSLLKIELRDLHKEIKLYQVQNLLKDK
ncbi:nickel-binding protein Mua [Helicobacter pylori]|uniref:nickel-binding protein Mua n=1 Tax=Helicobacter pylori TaxID=210 RepID=UPI0012B3C30D|nr:nickel-binding protein Mua [Helicobacter pylori]UOR45810.1 nickel-binding protein Mua [Helicobacter pylori]UOR98366.1 nickel-binding protein Mua [Helicobacter pylori]